MKVITLVKVKELLGISTTTYDTALTSAINYVDVAVKQITRDRWNYRVVATTELDSDLMFIASIVSPRYWQMPGYIAPIDDINEYVQTGQLVSGTGIPVETYISEVFYNYPDGVLIQDDEYGLQVQISEDATATGTDIAVYLGIPISYQPIIAKAVWWHTLQMNTTIADEAWKSKRMGPVSITKSDMDTKLDGKSGMPAWFVRALPKYQRGY